MLRYPGQRLVPCKYHQKKKKRIKASLGHTRLLTEELKNPNAVELKNWHPATGGNVYGPDDPDFGAVDLILPDNPAIVTRGTSRIWRLILSKSGHDSAWA